MKIENYGVLHLELIRVEVGDEVVKV